MSLRPSLIALLASSVFACVAAAGCASPTSEEEEDLTTADGDGTTEDELVSERQLYGSELPDKTVSLTFDDGPGRRTIELADYLAAEGIEGTFFINGAKVPGRQAALDAVVARGHLLANHTQHHLQLTRQSSAKIISEVEDTDAFITQVQPSRPFLIRAPFGAWNGSVARTINGTAMRKYVGSVFWEVGGQLTSTAGADWDCWGKGVSVERCGELYLQEVRAKRRGIVLLHDVHDRTIDLTKYVVPKLKAEGYAFVGLEAVPSIQRALGVAATSEPADPSSCASSTLGRSVPANACVQSRRDQKWYRCVDGDWTLSAPGDSRCAASHGI